MVKTEKRIKYEKEWYERNKKRISEFHKKRRKTNPEIYKRIEKNRSKESKLKKLEYSKKYGKEHPEQRRIAVKKHLMKYPERRRERERLYRMRSPTRRKKEYIRTLTKRKYGKLKKGFQYHHFEPYSRDNHMILETKTHKWYHKKVPKLIENKKKYRKYRI